MTPKRSKELEEILIEMFANATCSKPGEIKYWDNIYKPVEAAIEKWAKEKGHKCPWNKSCTCYQYYECNGCETYAESISGERKYFKLAKEKYGV